MRSFSLALSLSTKNPFLNKADLVLFEICLLVWAKRAQIYLNIGESWPLFRTRRDSFPLWSHSHFLSHSQVDCRWFSSDHSKPPRSHSGVIIEMLSFLSLLLFTLLHLERIAKSARAVPISEETSTFDFIVIGGGNAYVDLFLCSAYILDWRIIKRGMAVAGRLSEDPSITVAVLEAGVNVEDIPEVVLTELPRIHYTHRKSRCLFRVWLEQERPEL